MAGVVEELGRGVTRLRPGTACSACHGSRGKPPRTPSTSPRPPASWPGSRRGSATRAAALPLAGLTAWQALVETAGVDPKSRVLILAAAGGVGHLAVQVAKARGAYMIGTARAEKHAFLTSLGADEAVDYTTGPLAGGVHDVDVVLDLVGGETALDALSTLREEARSSPSPARRTRCATRRPAGVRLEGVLVEPDRLGMEALAELVAEGVLRPHVSADVPPRRRGARARGGRDGPHTGKLVLTVA